MERFRYLRDPLFLACVGIYFVNRWALKPLVCGGFLHDHLNDLICVPFWVPIMLWGQRTLGFRPSNGPPLASEIVIPLFVWSWFFEILLPPTGVAGSYAVADYRDIVYYALGGALAACVWRWLYRSRRVDDCGSAEDSAPTLEEEPARA